MNSRFLRQGSLMFGIELVTACKSPTLALQEDEDNDEPC